MPDAAARHAEASMRALDVHVQVLRAQLELARTPASEVSADAVPAAQLLRVAAAADALGQTIERVLERVDPGLGRHAGAIAQMMRAHVPPAHDAAAPARAEQGRDAATN